MLLMISIAHNVHTIVFLIFGCKFYKGLDNELHFVHLQDGSNCRPFKSKFVVTNDMIFFFFTL